MLKSVYVANYSRVEEVIPLTTLPTIIPTKTIGGLIATSLRTIELTGFPSLGTPRSAEIDTSPTSTSIGEVEKARITDVPIPFGEDGEVEGIIELKERDSGPYFVTLTVSRDIGDYTTVVQLGDNFPTGVGSGFVSSSTQSTTATAAVIHGSGTNKTGTIIGIVIGVLCGLLLLVGVGYVYFLRLKQWQRIRYQTRGKRRRRGGGGRIRGMGGGHPPVMSEVHAPPPPPPPPPPEA